MASASLQAEEALLRSQQRFELAMEASSEGLWDWDIESGEVTWSERTLSMLGYERSSFGGTFAFIEQILHASDREQVIESLRAHVERGASYDLDLRLRRGDGTFGIFHTRGTLLRDAQGRPLRMAGSIADVTETRRQARLLERAEAVAQIGGWELDARAGCVYFSGETCRLHRLEPSAVAPTLEAMLACYESESRALLAAAIQQGLAHAEPWDLELVLARAPRREVRVTGRAELEGGQVIALFGTVQDITTRKHAEDSLRRSEQRFRGYFEFTAVGLAISTPEKGLVEVNNRFCEQLGYTRDEILTLTWAELTHPDDLASDVSEFERVLVGEIDAYTINKRFSRKDGSLIHAEVSVRAVRKKDGSVDYCLGLLDDVSERVQAERVLRESEQKFLTAFRAGPNAIAISELDSGRILEVNESFEKLVGLPRAELLGKSSVALGMWSDEARARFVKALLGEGVVRDMELQSRNFKGERRVMLVSADITELDGRNCIILVVHDITERRRVEEAKARLEEELRQMQRLEAMGTLAGGLAHDFNNILGAIIAYVDLARMDASGNAPVLESLGEVLKACDRARRLVRQILVFSRRHPQERHSIRLQPLVKEVLRLVRPTLPATIEIKAEVQAETGRVDADTTQLHQVLVNLCTNAAHSMQGGAGRLTVELTEAEISEQLAAENPGLHPGRYARLSVCDTGHGMDVSTMKRMFEPFFTTKKPGDGTGLGLSVAHGIVSDHGGVIRVDSEPGKGTRVHVLLPVCATGAPEEEERPAPPRLGERERILFIDDEPALCVTAQKLLEKLNYRVHTETSALAALALFRGDPDAFDLVLTDLTMPPMTGVDVASEVLRIRPGLPVVVATGFNASWSRETVRAIGVSDLVLKPLSVAALADSIHAALHPGPA